MANSTAVPYHIDHQILIIDKTICDSIDTLDDASKRGFLSQLILSHLRNFVEHIMLKIYAVSKLRTQEIDDTWNNIGKAVEFVNTRGDLKFLRRFHDFLQISASHYTLEQESSERLMLKYYEYLLRIKDFVKTNYSLDVLENIDKFPLNTDNTLDEYYSKITEKIDRHRFTDPKIAKSDSYYIHKVKPFFVNQRIYYEVTFTPANEKASKFDRVIAFTFFDISQYYAVRLYVINDSIEILGKIMPVFVIVKWETSIRPCEINNFSRVLGADPRIQRGHSEYRKLMQYLTETGFSLVDIVDLPDDHFQSIKQDIVPNTSNTHFFDVLEACRDIIKKCGAGSNILRYLLYHLNNGVIKDQWDDSNERLSNLRLSYRCIPFDDMPFNSSLIGHNPRLFDLLDCIDPSNRRHEIFARLIRNNTELNGNLFTAVKDISGFDDVNALVATYNSKLYYKHMGRKLKIDKEHVYIKEYKDDTKFIVDQLIELAKSGVSNYSNSVNSWISSVVYNIDCPEKRQALIQMFEHSKVALIYGSAGTGKSTLINHISHFFSDKSKLFLANTNPAVDNLRRRVDASNCEFSTITRFVKKRNIQTDYDLLIIDECSTVSNRNMRAILEKSTFKLLVLVGDTFQIEAIQFGNWFSAAKSLMPKESKFELTKPYRTSNSNLLELWKRVRNMEDTIVELLAKQGYSTNLDGSIFEAAEVDEIILCLNYDGLYGINNINRFLQESNLNPGIPWGLQLFKVNDPILFNESERFAPLIYNNMKGRIVRIKVMEDQIQFDIELDKIINGMDVESFEDLELVEYPKCRNSVVRFSVDKYRGSDDDDDDSSSTVVPFQVAYAVSIHKAQGLEYSSVKIVITDEIDELITHNIFYTAITRAREKLRIYWTPEVEKKVLDTLKPRDYSKDVNLLRTI
ncbi:MAG TPA: ATP-dependent RecD-like DNA helicase [Ruminiclostridium sp.]|nr:ATP-dependent RecD-like DNA helicase [Ruminiclostridium sp.]